MPRLRTDRRLIVVPGAGRQRRGQYRCAVTLNKWLRPAKIVAQKDARLALDFGQLAKLAKRARQ